MSEAAADAEETAPPARRTRRLRSLSLSIDLRRTNTNDSFVEENQIHKASRSLGFASRNRNLSDTCFQNCHADVLGDDLKNLVKNGFLGRGRGDRFDFESLPTDCKLKVFSFLGAKGRGVAAKVCWEWHTIVRDASLWGDIDLTVFRLCSSTSPLHRECTLLCYDGYRRRLTKFLKFLVSVKPSINTLRFALDIGDGEDGWFDILQELLRVCRCKMLACADLNWTETPQKKPFFLPSTSVTWSHSDFKDLTFRRRRRQRYFIWFFDLFTACASNVTKLKVQFDWSEKSQAAIERLQNLRTLTLNRYFNYGHVDPESFCRLFRSMANLRRLNLEMWTESYGGFYLYRLRSDTLVYLDVSRCRGVYLEEMALPSLETFKVGRNPLNHELPMMMGMQETETPCMYDVLRSGAPNLVWLNDHRLRTDWREEVYQELEAVLAGICSCRVHKSHDA